MGSTHASPLEVGADGSGEVQVIQAREVPLGGLRSMSVRRTLPHRERSFIGAWCFIDHYGPDPVIESGGMHVAPHPHTGLQTVSWLFEGEIEHRDSGGVHALVRPGEVNLMTAGRGIAHSEVSTPDTATLHGVQLWTVLPRAARGGERDFQHYAAPLIQLANDVSARIFIGSLQGHDSPIDTLTALLGAEIVFSAAASLKLRVDSSFEHGLLLDCGEIRFCGTDLGPGELGVLDAGTAQLSLESAGPARAILLGGAPFEEEIVMWWNFIGSNDAEIRLFRQEWQDGADRFGVVPGYRGSPARLDAPELPAVRLRPRGRHGKR